jgi:hypothetical protein
LNKGKKEEDKKELKVDNGELKVKKRKRKSSYVIAIQI